MLSISIVFYFRSINSVRNILKSQTSIIAKRVSGEIENRYSSCVSDMILLCENRETQDFYQYYKESGIKKNKENFSSLRNFLELFYSYRHLYFVQGTFYGRNGRKLLTFGEDLTSPFPERIFSFKFMEEGLLNEDNTDLHAQTAFKILKIIL